MPALRLADETGADVSRLLRGQLVVSLSSGGRVLESTGGLMGIQKQVFPVSQVQASGFGVLMDGQHLPCAMVPATLKF